MKQIACISLFLMISCYQKEQAYPYESHFVRYMEEVHQLNLYSEQEAIYYLLPLDGCEPCLEAHRNAFSQLGAKRTTLKIILIGKNKNYSIQGEGLHFLYDTEKKSDAYRLGLGKPLMLHWKGKKVVHYELVSDYELETAIGYIGKTRE